MAKMNDMQKFIIDNHLSMNNTELSRITGLTPAQIQRRRNKIIGLNREGKPKGTPEENISPNPNREEELTKKSQDEAVIKGDKLLPVEGRPAPAMRIDALMAKKSGTVALTSAAAELSDMFDGIAPNGKGPVVAKHDPFSDPQRVHKIR